MYLAIGATEKVRWTVEVVNHLSTQGVANKLQDVAGVWPDEILILENGDIGEAPIISCTFTRKFQYE